MDQLVFFINKVLISGTVLGSIYALGAIGVTLIFGILRFAHFAHGDMMTLGAFFAFLLGAGVLPLWHHLPDPDGLRGAAGGDGADRRGGARHRQDRLRAAAQARRQAGDAADRLDRRDADDAGPDPAVLRHRPVQLFRLWRPQSHHQARHGLGRGGAADHLHRAAADHGHRHGDPHRRAQLFPDPHAARQGDARHGRQRRPGAGLGHQHRSSSCA